MNAVAVILAAGQPKNLAHPKALFEHEGGRSFLKSLASTFNKAGAVPLAVIGSGAAEVRAQHPDVELVEHPGWAEGLWGSVKAGVEEALGRDAELIALHPVDQPAIRASTLTTLLKRAGAEDGPGVMPEFESVPGLPLILTPEGARRLLELDRVSTLQAADAALMLTRVQVKDPGVLVNINSPEVYERLFGSAPRLAPPPRKRGKKTA